MNIHIFNVINKVATIDIEAANYIKQVDVERVGMPNRRHIDIASMFSWRNTPQGYDYWANINRQIDRRFNQ